MANVKATVVVYARLVAQYGNFRLYTLRNGNEVRVPSVYNMTVFEFPPTSIELPPMDFEYFVDNIDEVLDLMRYNDKFLTLKQYLDHVDTKKISMPDTIPVSDVPIEYVSYRNNSVNRNVITPNGINELDRSPFDIRGIYSDDDEDDDDGLPDEDEIEVENVVRFVSPNFIYQTMNWATAIDIGSFSFVEDKPHSTIPDNIRAKATPISKILSKLGLQK